VDRRRWRPSTLTAILGKIVLVGLSWAFFQHAATGIRHLVLDIGVGYELSAMPVGRSSR
jgi:succinate dehydrogenase / fumarate reductase cytochrome b subunit